MSKTLQVARRELRTALGRPAYIIFAYILPVAAVLILAGIRAYQSRPGADLTAASEPSESEIIDVEGYVDPGGLIQVIPDDIPPGRLIAFPDEAAARQALLEGEIDSYYLIPADYIASGTLYYVYPDDRSYLGHGQEWIMTWTLMVNLVGDQELASQVWSPIWNMEEVVVQAGSGEDIVLDEDCSRPGAACQSNELVQAIPAIMVVVFYITIMSSSSMLFQSVTTEKENRVAEVLLVSLRPNELLTGKILGLGTAGLLQTIIWLTAVYAASLIGGSTLNLPEGFTLPLDLLAWGLVFFLAGFWMYAALMAGAGVMVPRMKESGIANLLIMSPLLIAYMIGILAPLARSTTAALPIALSYFPLTSPILMIMRLADSVVPFWQVALSAALTIAAAWWINRAVAGMFRAQYLLSGQPFSAGRFFKAMVGRD